VNLPLPDHIQLSIDDYRFLFSLETFQISPIYLQVERPQTTAIVKPSTPAREVIKANGRSSSGGGGGAPIAQAECSDTDYDTARSLARAASVEKNGSLHSGSTLRAQRDILFHSKLAINMFLPPFTFHIGQKEALRREVSQNEQRAQSADSRSAKSNGASKGRRRSIERPRMFSGIKPSRLMNPHKLISNY
ncbi:unnamed protein product, partial [Strongylus vulgaris]